MRLSVQLRRPLDTPGEGERWVRSVYVDSTPRDIIVRFDDMRPVPPARTPHPPLDKVHALLFVVDTEHTPPGTSGRVLIEGPALRAVVPPPVMPRHRERRALHGPTRSPGGRR